MWEAASGQCVYTQPRPPGPGRELTHCALARAAGLLLSVTADHNLLLYDVRSLRLQKQVSARPPVGLRGGSLAQRSLGLVSLPPLPSSLGTTRRCWTCGSSGLTTPTSSWLPIAPA